jgi:ABC-2 type transport system ATP-binding protein
VEGIHVIEMKEVTRSFGSLVAVDRVSLSVPGGQILGYLGPNGAGKTTTVRMLTGMIRPDSGSITVSGFDIGKDPLEVKRRIGFVPESGAIYQSLTPMEYLELIGNLYGMDEQAIRRHSEELFVFFQLEKQMHEPMPGFSKGMKQKVVIASALLHNPSVIFLDEPLNGLDANTVLRMKTLLRTLADEGKTIFYCSHILEVVENLCDRVVIIDDGKVVADGSVQKLKEMTERSSLEGVFSKLTHAEDVEELAKAFSQRITGKDSAS